MFLAVARTTCPEVSKFNPFLGTPFLFRNFRGTYFPTFLLRIVLRIDPRTSGSERFGYLISHRYPRGRFRLIGHRDVPSKRAPNGIADNQLCCFIKYQLKPIVSTSSFVGRAFPRSFKHPSTRISLHSTWTPFHMLLFLLHKCHENLKIFRVSRSSYLLSGSLPPTKIKQPSSVVHRACFTISSWTGIAILTFPRNSSSASLASQISRSWITQKDCPVVL